jgi:hypothetical protein
VKEIESLIVIYSISIRNSESLCTKFQSFAGLDHI